MTCNGFCLYSANGPKCRVNEFAFTSGYFDTILSVLNKDFSEITVDLPVSFNCSDNEGIINDNGMALAVTESAESVINDINNAYLSLTLE